MVKLVDMDVHESGFDTGSLLISQQQAQAIAWFIEISDRHRASNRDLTSSSE